MIAEANDSHASVAHEQGFIRTLGLSKTYRSASGVTHALDNVSIEVHRGEIVAFLGPSGCGKSTLLEILAGLTPLTSGSATVHGEKPRPRPEVGLMFQQALLFPWRTVAANVMLPAELIDVPDLDWNQRANELLEMVGLGGWGPRYHWELSGGMQQRVALARVLLLDPEVLLLDEPFGALDEMTRESLDTELMHIAHTRNTTVAMVTHNVYEATLVADRIFVFTARPGRIAGVVDIDEKQPRDIGFSTTNEFSEKVAQVRALLSDKE